MGGGGSGKEYQGFGRKMFDSYCQKFSSRNPLEFRSTRVSKKFMNDWGVEGERKRHVFTSIIFCLTVPKSFKKEPFVLWFRKLQGSKKFEKKGGMREYQDFRQKQFSLSAENFGRSTF